MNVAITKALANEIVQWNLTHPVSIIWHGGEPLSTGIKYFKHLIQPFAELVKRNQVIHEIQTNASLINETWVDLFTAHNFKVGVSIDGPEWANRNRRDWNDIPSFSRALKGIECLKRNNISFSAIAVVTKDTLGHADDLFSFFSLLGCSTLGINFEEKEGVNIPLSYANENEVTTFWTTLFRAWRANPGLNIREFGRVFRYFDNLIQTPNSTDQSWNINVFPTIACNGDVVALSPELAETASHQFSDFVIGNITRRPLKDIVSQAYTHKYVDNFMKGVEICRSICEYFEFCRGGQASNKFFETGDFSVTQTEYCRNSKIKLVESILAEIEDDYENCKKP